MSPLLLLTCYLKLCCLTFSLPTRMMLNMFLLKVKEILTDYDPNFMAMSLDEAYLNITKHLEERKNWPEDKRKYFTAGTSLENGKQFIRMIRLQKKTPLD